MSDTAAAEPASIEADDEADESEPGGSSAVHHSGGEPPRGAHQAARNEDAVSERHYRLVECRYDAGGALWCRAREKLTSKVYSRSVALRYAAYEAQRLPKRESLLAMIDSTGRVVTVLAGGTGKPVGISERRLVRQAIADQMGVRHVKRTSRPASERRDGSRRTSRKPHRRR